MRLDFLPYAFPIPRFDCATAREMADALAAHGETDDFATIRGLEYAIGRMAGTYLPEIAERSPDCVLIHQKESAPPYLRSLDAAATLAERPEDRRAVFARLAESECERLPLAFCRAYFEAAAGRESPEKETFLGRLSRLPFLWFPAGPRRAGGAPGR